MMTGPTEEEKEEKQTRQLNIPGKSQIFKTAVSQLRNVHDIVGKSPSVQSYIWQWM